MVTKNVNPKLRERVRFFDEDFNESEGEIIENNGDLTLIETDDGRPLWLADFEIEKKEKMHD